MDEFDLIYKNEFFILSSDNLENVKTKFYGYAITNEGFIWKNPEPQQLDGTGCYIYIHKVNDEISIYQDFNGSYGLFLYKKDDYFAISNSFMKLIEYLKDKREITLNEDYAYSYITANYCSTIYEQTLINEISILPYDYIVQINVTEKTLNFNRIDYKEKTVPIESKECLEILDKWYNKWTTIFNYLYSQTKNIQFDLSGGFDTRVNLCLLLSSNKNVESIYVNAFSDETPTFADDYKISSRMAEDFGFKLNSNIPLEKKYYFQDLKTSINLSYYVRGGFAKQMYWKNMIYIEPRFKISGFGGGIIRDFYQNPSIDSNIVNHSYRSQKYSNEAGRSTNRILHQTFDELSKLKNNELDKSELFLIHFRNTRNRYSFGTQMSEAYLTNTINICPLLDPLLNKLKINNNSKDFDYLIYCLIYLRYYPKLLEYPFEGNRKITKETVEYARNINSLQPYKQSKVEHIKENLNLNIKSLKENSEKIKHNDQYNYLLNVFNTTKFKKMFSTYFPQEIYDTIKSSEEKLHPDSPRSDLNASMITMKIVFDIIFNQLKFNENPYDFFNEIIENPVRFEDYSNKPKMTDARIDLINNGKQTNDLIVLDSSDKNVRLLKPEWFSTSKGIGLEVESSCNTLKLTIKCVNDGKLHVKLKSRNVWNENNERIYLTYKKVLINSKRMIKGNYRASHDDEIIIKRNVSDGEIIKLHIEWEYCD